MIRSRDTLSHTHTHIKLHTKKGNAPFFEPVFGSAKSNRNETSKEATKKEGKDEKRHRIKHATKNLSWYCDIESANDANANRSIHTTNEKIIQPINRLKRKSHRSTIVLPTY